MRRESDRRALRSSDFQRGNSKLLLEAFEVQPVDSIRLMRLLAGPRLRRCL
jgi:hypothetical protein